MSEVILWLVFSYLFASIPQGYLIVRWWGKGDIRRIGREKLSASNIIENVGFLPGLLSGLIDAFKGAIAVFGAQCLGFSGEIQALSGLLAICGQMWPCFLRFWGGRGGATSVGALLVLSPKIVFFSGIIWILLKLISKDKGAAIGMMLFYLCSGGLGFYFKIKEVMIFSSLALVLILIQRLLGKPGSLRKIQDKKVILWRILLDRDTKEK